MTLLGETNKRFIRRFQKTEVRESLKKMKGGKVIDPNSIPIKAWRCLRDTAIVWLTKLFNHISGSNKMSDESRNILMPIYKNKRDTQSCIDYLRIKLISHNMRELSSTV